MRTTNFDFCKTYLHIPKIGWGSFTAGKTSFGNIETPPIFTFSSM
jgi:hypothetical protein